MPKGKPKKDVVSAEDEELIRKTEMFRDGSNVHECNSKTNLLISTLYLQANDPNTDHSWRIDNARKAVRHWIANELRKRRD